MPFYPSAEKILLYFSFNSCTVERLFRSRVMCKTTAETISSPVVYNKKRDYYNVFLPLNTPERVTTRLPSWMQWTATSPTGVSPPAATISHETFSQSHTSPPATLKLPSSPHTPPLSTPSPLTPHHHSQTVAPTLRNPL